MKSNDEQLSAFIDNEMINDALLDELIINEQQQEQFSRYHLIGDAMRGEINEPVFDISQNVMDKIAAQSSTQNTNNVETFIPNKRVEKKNNVVSFVRRFGQYAIAASVAGVVVVTSLVTSPSGVENGNQSIEVLNTVPFGGGAAPVSLQATPTLSKEAIQARNERLEALLKDHQLQLQTQP
ncbi:sigma-E factor negative regulatory protein [Psychromonas sp. PT13]|uniref:sigma-E factor negative regulatory protein n=1 Tax=Psychromonas sp. PT13 TaxID=3439547 RepID=UPI003EBB1098